MSGQTNPPVKAVPLDGDHESSSLSSSTTLPAAIASPNTPVEATNKNQDVELRKELQNQNTSNDHHHHRFPLLSDSTLNSIPRHLENYFQHYQLKDMTNAEILFHLVYLMALETGFIEKGCLTDPAIETMNILSSSSNSNPFYFKARNVCYLSKQKPSTLTIDKSKMKFRMELCSPECKTILTLNGIASGEFLIITLTPDSVVMSLSICLTISRYVLNSRKILQQRLRKMDDLSFRLRDEIFVPMRNQLFALHGVGLYPSLLGLPMELYDYIFHCLSPKELRILSEVCKQLHQLIINSKHYNRRTSRNLSFHPPFDISLPSFI